MRNYLNPGNEALKYDSQDEMYVDKTGLIRFINRVLNTPAKCLSVSHARRFGKSQAAGMIEVYSYSAGRSCNLRQPNRQIITAFTKLANMQQMIFADIMSLR